MPEYLILLSGQKSTHEYYVIPRLERDLPWYFYYIALVGFAHYSENRITMSFCLHHKLGYVIIKVQSQAWC